MNPTLTFNEIVGRELRAAGVEAQVFRGVAA